MATALAARAADDRPVATSYALSAGDRTTFARDLAAFLDAAHTATGRATHDNTAEEQRAAENVAHANMIRHDPLLYGLLLTLPGVQDRARQAGLLRLLAAPPISSTRLSVDAPETVGRMLVPVLARDLPAPRLLRAMAALRQERRNSGRVRRFVMRTVLGHRDLPFWCVKYRRHLRVILRHAMGERAFGAVATIGARAQATWSKSERRLVARHLFGTASLSPADADVAVCLAYLAGREIEPDALSGRKLAIFAARKAAATELEAGGQLPVEVLEGIRSTYHRARPHSDVLALSGHTMTSKQAAGAQKEARRAGVEVAFDPRRVPAERLYVLSFEHGEMSAEIRAALDEKAEAAAAGFPLRHDKVVVVLDASASMAGPDARPIGNRRVSEQKWRPISCALALADVLVRTAPDHDVVIIGGREHGKLVWPQGETSLAGALVDAIRKGPDAVYIVSDGYENAPAGRTGEVITRLRDFGVTTPIVHVNPVLAAEAGSVRSLLPDAPAVAAAQPSALATHVMRGMLEQAPELVAAALAERALRLLNVA